VGQQHLFPVTLPLNHVLLTITMCIPLQFGQPFRRNSGTCSAAIQAPIPVHFGHPLTHKTNAG
jgi:hypothetical protein